MASKPDVRRRRSARQVRTENAPEYLPRDALEYVPEEKWFIEPLNTPANIMISRVVDEENLQREIDTTKGRRPALWECPEEIAENFIRSGGDEVWFRIYFQVGDGPITWIYTYKGSGAALSDL